MRAHMSHIMCVYLCVWLCMQVQACVCAYKCVNRMLGVKHEVTYLLYLVCICACARCTCVCMFVFPACVTVLRALIVSASFVLSFV